MLSEAQRKALLETRGWFPSKYGGRCYECGKPYNAGDPISASGRSGIASWRGACCA